MRPRLVGNGVRVRNCTFFYFVHVLRTLYGITWLVLYMYDFLSSNMYVYRHDKILYMYMYKIYKCTCTKFCHALYMYSYRLKTILLVQRTCTFSLQTVRNSHILPLTKNIHHITQKRDNDDGRNSVTTSQRPSQLRRAHTHRTLYQTA